MVNEIAGSAGQQARPKVRTFKCIIITRRKHFFAMTTFGGQLTGQLLGKLLTNLWCFNTFIYMSIYIGTYLHYNT